MVKSLPKSLPDQEMQRYGFDPWVRKIIVDKEIATQFRASLVAHTVKRLAAMWETWVWSPGREDPLEKEMATHPLQYSCLESPMDRETCWATVHRVTKSASMHKRLLEPEFLIRLESKTLQLLLPILYILTGTNKWFLSLHCQIYCFYRLYVN